MARPTINASSLQRMSKTVVKPRVRQERKPSCERCVPDPECYSEDHNPIDGELEFVKAKGWLAYLALPIDQLYFLHKYGLVAYNDCMARGYAPTLDQETVDGMNEKYEREFGK